MIEFIVFSIGLLIITSTIKIFENIVGIDFK